MKALVGLGNPGSFYAQTRHNIGYMLVDWIRKKGNFSKFGRTALSVVFVGEYPGGELLLVKPTTYMNRSGLAVRALLQKFSLPLEAILIACDDVNLPFGVLRIRQKGSAGGHKGLESIVNIMETHSFHRLRLGVGSASREKILTDFVLSPFTSEERESLPAFLETGARAFETWAKQGIESVMRQFNRRFS